jgi:hypothetical protein
MTASSALRLAISALVCGATRRNFRSEDELEVAADDADWRETIGVTAIDDGEEDDVADDDVEEVDEIATKEDVKSELSDAVGGIDPVALVCFLYFSVSFCTMSGVIPRLGCGGRCLFCCVLASFCGLSAMECCD